MSSYSSVSKGRRDVDGGGPSSSSSPGSLAKKSGFGSGPVGLAVATLVWYALTVVYSVYNTAVLRVFPFPLTVLTAELAAGVLLILPAWVLGIVRTPNLRMSQVRVCLCVRGVSDVLNCGALTTCRSEFMLYISIVLICFVW